MKRITSSTNSKIEYPNVSSSYPFQWQFTSRDEGVEIKIKLRIKIYLKD